MSLPCQASRARRAYLTESPADREYSTGSPLERVGAILLIQFHVIWPPRANLLIAASIASCYITNGCV